MFYTNLYLLYYQFSHPPANRLLLIYKIVEAKDHAPEIVVHLTKGICHEDPTIAAKQCFYEVLNEEGDDYYTRCNCRDADGRQGDFGHYCTCFH